MYLHHGFKNLLDDPPLNSSKKNLVTCTFQQIFNEDECLHKSRNSHLYRKSKEREKKIWAQLHEQVKPN